MARYTGHLVTVGQVGEVVNKPLALNHRHYDGSDNGHYPYANVSPPTGEEFLGTDFEQQVSVQAGNDHNMLNYNHNSPAVLNQYARQVDQQNASLNIHNQGDDPEKLNLVNQYYQNADEHYVNFLSDATEPLQGPDVALKRGLNSYSENSPFVGPQRPSLGRERLTQNIDRIHTLNEARSYEPVPLKVPDDVAIHQKGSKSNAGSIRGNYFASAEKFQVKNVMTPYMYRNPTGNNDSLIANDTTDYITSPGIEGGGF